MKTLTNKITQTLALALLVVPAISHAKMRVDNNTDQMIKVAIYRGDVLIGTSNLLSQQYSLADENPPLRLSAKMIQKGNTYTARTVAMNLERSSDFNATVYAEDDTQEFALEESEASSLGMMTLNNNLAQETQFTIQSPSTTQNIVIPAYSQKRLSVEASYKIVIVANGVTLKPVMTSNPNVNVSVSSSIDANGNETYQVRY